MIDVSLIERKYADAIKGIKKEWLFMANTEWFDHIVSLPKDIRITYLVTILNVQVINGGFHQYFVNGYGQFAPETIIALYEIEAIKKSRLLKKAFKIVNSNESPINIFREKLLKKEIKPLFSGEELFEPLNILDTEFYTIDDENLDELLSNFLTSLEK